ncbi:MAG: DegT/DnrJ/EryC1/StrS family aminotransferase [Magnetococcus sp. YQC-3]
MIMMNDFKKEQKIVYKSILDAVERVASSGSFVLGSALECFEKLWSSTCGTEFGVGVGNGHDALEISLRSLNIGAGDEVITTPMTAFATVLAILGAGATPVFADIESDTALMSIESVQRCLTSRTKAILLVHLYGQIKNMEDWVMLCETYNLSLIEDCAHAHIAHWRGRPAGSFGKASAFSFYPTKNLGAMGDAGMVVTNDQSLAEKARCLRNYGYHNNKWCMPGGMNSRMDELQASILTEKLKWLDDFTSTRYEIAKKYHASIKNSRISMLSSPEDHRSHVYHLFVVNCEERDDLQAYLLNNGIQTLTHYKIPVHEQGICKTLPRDKFGLSNSIHHSNTCLSLPCHPHMENHEVESVVECINMF